MVIKEIEGFVTRKEMCALMAAVDAVIWDFEHKVPLCFAEFESYVQLKKVSHKLRNVMEEIKE